MKPADPKATPRWVGISTGDLSELQGGGLGEFCLQVGQRIANGLAETAGPPLKAVFHVHPRLIGCFGKHVNYRAVQRGHRWLHTGEPTFALWHSLHQLNKNLPPRLTGLRVVTVHDLNYLHGNNAFSRWRHQRRMRALLARTDVLTTISAFSAGDVRQHLGWRQDITVIHNGARSFVAAPQTPLPGWHAQPDRPFLLHLSRLSPSKNPQALLTLAAAWPDMCFVLAGPRNHDSLALQAQCKLPNVQFHLGVSEAQKAWAYGACAGFLFPSLAEGFGLPPIEAMHFGKPVFLSRYTSLPEVGGELAHYFDSYDGPAMRTVVEGGLAQHAADPSRADALRAHAARFSWDRAGAAYLALYRRLLAGAPP